MQQLPNLLAVPFPAMRDAALPGIAAMRKADRLAGLIHADGTFALMQRAAYGLMDHVLERHADAARIAILCGPGNNGGDGLLLALRLAERGVDVAVFGHERWQAGTDAARARSLWRGPVRPLASFAPDGFGLIVDALFGAGLTRAPAGDAARIIEASNASGLPIVSVDVPSGLNGDTGLAGGAVIHARSTVTFFRKKPGHVLEPGRTLCGELIVIDIGIPAGVLSDLGIDTFENLPALWQAVLPRHAVTTHKYARGAVGVVSGGSLNTGAARLAALAAERAGAGAVTLLGSRDALPVLAAQLTSAMVQPCETSTDLSEFLSQGKTGALVVGPAAGVNARTAQLLDCALEAGAPGGRLRGLVLDADALTVIARDKQRFFAKLQSSPMACVLTPHEGEFARLFPDMRAGSKLDRARAAAALSGATVLLKGPDTVIAAPDGRAAINTNGTQALATAGSGDVLAGVIAALLAQGMPQWEAACAGAWLHAEAGRLAGEGAGAERIAKAVMAAVSRAGRA
ncbi:MAG: NAD(P)H-hydrate dehydratase [Rhizobiaceae bacterium]|nr:NAD(P)H-hydrate dehydratase [Rhizobiaceae bacterium]